MFDNIWRKKTKSFMIDHLNSVFKEGKETNLIFASTVINFHRVVKICSKLYTFEPCHEISNIVVCATSKASDQPAHMRSLIRAFASSMNIL